MIEELIRKLEHLSDFKNLKKENETYKEYVKNLFSSANLEPLDTLLMKDWNRLENLLSQRMLINTKQAFPHNTSA